MDFEIFFRYWYAPLCSGASVVCGYAIAVLIQNRQFRHEDRIRKDEQEAQKISTRPNPIELDILRHCQEQPPENGQNHFQGITSIPYINKRPVKNYISSVIQDSLHSLERKGYIEIICDNDFVLSFTMLIDRAELARVIKEAEDRVK